MRNRFKLITGNLRNSFFTGILAFLPIVLTIYLVIFLGSKINTLIIKVTPQTFLPYITENNYSLLFRILILLFLIVIITIIGMFTKVYIGREIISFGEKLIDKIPILNKIYQAINQISKAFFGKKSSIFKKVVLIQYPRIGVFSLGFLTGMAKGEIQKKTNEKLYNIFIPTTPNPTSGMLVMYPESAIEKLDMTVEEGMKLIISGGAVTPKYKEI
jgi:uncharacterized membrane protein